jgi:hypothetical protein
MSATAEEMFASMDKSHKELKAKIASLQNQRHLMKQRIHLLVDQIQRETPTQVAALQLVQLMKTLQDKQADICGELSNAESALDALEDELHETDVEAQWAPDRDEELCQAIEKRKRAWNEVSQN